MRFARHTPLAFLSPSMRAFKSLRSLSFSRALKNREAVTCEAGYDTFCFSKLIAALKHNCPVLFLSGKDSKSFSL